MICIPSGGTSQLHHPRSCSENHTSNIRLVAELSEKTRTRTTEMSNVKKYAETLELLDGQLGFPWDFSELLGWSIGISMEFYPELQHVTTLYSG